MFPCLARLVIRCASFVKLNSGRNILRMADNFNLTIFNDLVADFFHNLPNFRKQSIAMELFHLKAKTDFQRMCILIK